MILENKEYEIRSSIKCDCGHEFEAREMEELKRINQDGFYGNIIKHYGHATCPNCGKKVVLLMKQLGQTYKVIDTASLKEVQTAIKRPVINVDSKINNSNEFICLTCGKVCKSQLGLNSHLKTHQNN